MDLVERFHTVTAQRIVLEAITRLSVYDKDLNKPKDDILNTRDIAKTFDEAKRRLKSVDDEKTAENYQKQIEIAEELAGKIDLLNEINALSFDGNHEFGRDDRKAMYAQLKQLHRDQQTVLLSKIRRQHGRFKIEHIKVLFKDVRDFLPLLFLLIKLLKARKKLKDGFQQHGIRFISFMLLPVINQKYAFVIY